MAIDPQESGVYLVIHHEQKTKNNRETGGSGP